MHLSQNTHYNVQFKVVMRSRICTFGVQEATQLYLIIKKIKKHKLMASTLLFLDLTFTLLSIHNGKFPLSLPKAVPWFKHFHLVHKKSVHPNLTSSDQVLWWINS
jgi:hypothetical protein